VNPKCPSTLDKYFDSAQMLIYSFKYICKDSGILQVGRSTGASKEQLEYMQLLERKSKDRGRYSHPYLRSILLVMSLIISPYREPFYPTKVKPSVPGTALLVPPALL
jgi:hypothetical protein